MMEKKKEQKPKAPNKRKAKKLYFVRRLSIPGFRFVDQGDEVSKEALAAWKKKTKVPIDRFVTDKTPE